MRRFAVLIALAGLLVGCVATEDAIPPRISLGNVALEAPGLLRQDLLIDLRIGNPNNFDIPIEGLTMQLEIDGQPFAEGYSNERLTLPRLAEISVPMKASTDTFAIIREVMSLGQRQSIRYKMTGYAYIVGSLGSSRVPYERSGDLQFTPVSAGRAMMVPAPTAT